MPTTNPQPKTLQEELIEACMVALAALRGEVSPSVAEWKLEEVLKRAKGSGRTESDADYLEAQFSGLERMGEGS